MKKKTEQKDDNDDDDDEGQVQEEGGGGEYEDDGASTCALANFVLIIGSIDIYVILITTRTQFKYPVSLKLHRDRLQGTNLKQRQKLRPFQQTKLNEHQVDSVQWYGTLFIPQCLIPLIPAGEQKTNQSNKN